MTYHVKTITSRGIKKLPKSKLQISDIIVIYVVATYVSKISSQI